MKTAVIIGAGIAGLATALRLQQVGWRPVVIEHAPALRDGGYAVSFAGIGMTGAEHLGILDALTARNIPAGDMVYLRPNGTVRYTIPTATVAAMQGRRTLSLLRGDIERVLYDAVAQHAEFRFGTDLTGVDQDPGQVRVSLSDGSVLSADLLIGADGLHSATRRLVFGPERRYRRDLAHLAGVFLLDRLPDGVSPSTTASLTASGRTLAIIDVGGGTSAAFLAYRADDTDRELADGPVTALSRAFDDMAWVASDVLDQLARADSVYFDTVSQMVVDGWSRGRVALVGDAAWCVTLFAGFGSALAVGGADLLGTALERHPDDIGAALSAWEAELRPEAERKQTLGRRVKGLYAPRDPFRLWLRDLPLRLAALPPVTRYLQRRLQIT